MKKKILFGLCLFTISVVLIFNVAIATNGSNSGLSLDSLGFCFQAQAENGSTDTQCNGTQCMDVNGLHYRTAINTGTLERTCCGICTESDRGCKSSN